MEALNVSVNEFGYVNLAYMLSIYEPDITNAKEELAEKSGQTVDEITLSDDALAEPVSYTHLGCEYESE